MPKILGWAMAASLLAAGCGLDPLHTVPSGPVAGQPNNAFPGPVRNVPPTPVAAERQRLNEMYPARSTAPASAPRAGAATPPTAVAPPAPSAPSPGANDVTLNFEQADVRDVVRAVLGDLLKVNYVIDPAVTGMVTLRTQKPIAREALLPTLEAVLATRGAQLSRSGDLYRVSAGPAGAAAAAGGGVGQVMQAFALSYVSAAEMRKAIEVAAPRSKVTEVDSARNTVLVSGNSEDLALAREAVGILDVNQMSGQGVVLVGLENAEAAVVAGELENMFSPGGKGALAGLVRFIAIPRMNAVMAVSPQQRYLDEARSWIMRLDRTRNADERQFFVYHMQHGKASDLARTLRGLFAPDAAPPADAKGEQAAQGQANPSGQMRGSQAAAQRTQSAASAYGLGVPVIQGPDMRAADPGSRGGLTLLSRPGELSEDAGGGPIRISADPVNNALLVSATPRDYARVQDAIHQLDLMPLQVLLEASIVEIVLRDQLRYGIQYVLQHGGLGLTEGGRVVLSANPTAAILPNLPGFGFTLTGSNGDPRLIIDALSELTDVKVVSSPRLLVLDNQIARLQVGDAVPIVTQTSTSTLTNNPQVVNSIQYRDTGITLEITPRVTASGLVTLEIGQEVSDVQRTTTSNIDSPTIRQRRLLSTVAVQNGETVLLGGLIREENSGANAGIPVLRELPGVGPFFGQTDNRSQRTELIVLVNPRVLRNTQDARDATQDTLRRFEHLVGIQRDGLKPPRVRTN